jgi:hypothetical protein
LFEQTKALWVGPQPDRAFVTSPFFDRGADALRTVEPLERMLTQRGDREIVFEVPGRRLPDGSVQLDVPDSLGRPSQRGAIRRFCFIPELTADSERRPLHAKSLWVERDARAVFVVGSSNFTAAGTGVGRPNIELNLAYILPDVASPFSKRCIEASPPSEEVDPANETVKFLDDGADRTAEPEGYATLPSAFGTATWRSTPTGEELELEIVGEPPPGFVVETADGAIVLDDAAWTATGRSVKVVRSWASPRPPSHLKIRWEGEGQRHTAIWVVNVADAGQLPPPEELRSLTLEELLDVLTSSRPYFESLSRVLRKRDDRTSGTPSVEVDPHRKVDTRGFLLRRMKRVAGALEGLRDRLERPIYSMEALCWRLHGPLGVLALASRLASEEGEGAAFMIAEVARTTAAARLELSGEVPRDLALRDVKAVVHELEALARRNPAPTNLVAYVEGLFQELRS